MSVVVSQLGMLVAVVAAVAQTPDAPPPAAAAPPAAATAPTAATAVAAPAAAPAPAPAPAETVSATEAAAPAAAPTDPPRTILVDPTSTPPAAPRDAGVTVVVHQVAPLPPPPPPPAAGPAPRQAERRRFFISGYGGFSSRFSSVASKVGFLFGGEGGLLLGRRVSIGAAAYNLEQRFGQPIRNRDGQALDLDMTYAGMTLGVVAIRRGGFELGLKSLFGAGSGCLKYRNVSSYEDEDYCVEDVGMFVAEPELMMNFSPWRWLKSGVTVGYRAVAREAWSNSNNYNLSGGYVGFNLHFGWFARD